MKTVSTALKGITCSLIAGLVLSGCLGDGNTPTTPDAPTAYMTIYHGAPSLAGLDIYSSDTKINTATFSYTTNTGYALFYAGNQHVVFKNTGTSTAVIDTTVALTADAAYSLFLINDVNKAKVLLVKDAPDALSGNNAKIRFVNLSPDSPEAELMIDTETTPLSVPRGFKEVSEYVNIPEGIYTFNIVDPDNDDIITYLSKTKITAGMYYTVIARGYITPPGGNTNKIGIDLEANQ